MDRTSTRPAFPAQLCGCFIAFSLSGGQLRHQAPRRVATNLLHIGQQPSWPLVVWHMDHAGLPKMNGIETKSLQRFAKCGKSSFVLFNGVRATGVFRICN